MTAGPILDAWLYHIIQEGKHVLIVTYGCTWIPGRTPWTQSCPVSISGSACSPPLTSEAW